MVNADSGERTPVLALHCTLGSSAQWRSLARAMPEREVIALDLLGYGDAPYPAATEDFALDDEVDAIEQQLLDRNHENTPLHVVGHSYGGAVAWRFALRHPTWVRTITLFEPTMIWLLADDPRADAFRDLAKLTTRAIDMGSTTQAAQRFIDFWSGPGAFASLPAEKQSALATRMRKVRLDFVACLSERSSVPGRGLLQMPALLMNSSNALPMMRRGLYLLQQAFGECTRAEVAGGHMAPIENRAQVDALIAAFIRKHEELAANPDLMVA